ncbi:hypothetical protein A7976_13605 [Methylobacillus sp. MM3]|uniref:sce7725 family protein n=1 Tax=Methylobacillus sp. MM3 TaxID=1848039 RepID=UPI0007DFEFEE|nr:sce7725 family protein [Methylobacillus sp. MM3]OAJ69663.1 hypothetical protein A7976_13605 [Methylobacillus sp. MM3]
MYYPYVRGKQFELLMLREMAPKIAEWGFTPVIEPVKKNFSVLKRALDELCENNCNFVLIANPYVGEFQKNDASSLVQQIIEGHIGDYANFSVGIHLSSENTFDQASQILDQFDRPISIIHNGFSEGQKLSELIAEKSLKIQEHIFIEKQNSRLYRKHFGSHKRVLIEDGFINRKNREHPASEPFSELYLTYDELGCQGFGDFLMVGSEFSEGGGPAYAIAIHLTYVDPEADNSIAIKHYVSKDVDTPKNPGGKCLQALQKLYDDVTSDDSLVYKSNAVNEYLQFYEEQHFPGLGYMKKLSMQHHLELMAHVLNKEA